MTTKIAQPKFKMPVGGLTVNVCDKPTNIDYVVLKDHCEPDLQECVSRAHNFVKMQVGAETKNILTDYNDGEFSVVYNAINNQ